MVVGEVPLPLCQGDHTRLDLMSWDRKRLFQIDRWSGTLSVLICDVVGKCPKELFFFLREPYIREAIQEENCFLFILFLNRKKTNNYFRRVCLVCGGSPKICVLVERKSRLRVK